MKSHQSLSLSQSQATKTHQSQAALESFAGAPPPKKPCINAVFCSVCCGFSPKGSHPPGFFLPGKSLVGGLSCGGTFTGAESSCDNLHEQSKTITLLLVKLSPRGAELLHLSWGNIFAGETLPQQSRVVPFALRNPFPRADL